VGRVAGGGLPLLRLACKALRRQVEGTRLLKGDAQQLLVRLRRFLVAIEPEPLQVDLVLKLQVALRRAHPDGAGRSGQGRQDALEELSEVVGRKQVQLRQASNFLEQAL